MPLDKAEYSRRLDAALALAGKTRAEVNEVLARPEWGMDKDAASRAGRPGDEKRPTKTLSAALGYLLGVGEQWFEEPEWWELIQGAAPPSIDERAEEKSMKDARAQESKRKAG